MGDIGHDVLLHKMRNWQIRAALRGYFRKQRPIFEASRQLGWWVLSSLGAKDLRTPSDLVKFPWENGRSGGGEDLTDEDIEELRREMNRINSQ